MEGRRRYPGSLAIAACAVLLTSCGWPALFSANTHNAAASEASKAFQLDVLPETHLDGATGNIAMQTIAPSSGTMDVALQTADARGLKALYAKLHFDPARWTPASVEWTAALAGPERRLALAIMPSSPGGQPGEITLGCIGANWDTQPGFSGSGVLCRVHFAPAAGPCSAAPRLAAVAPTSPGAAAELSYDAGTQELAWYYAFPGDFDQNGEASITDMTALGQHFHDTSPGGAGTPFPAGSLGRAVDGDNNGEINGADISSLGQNYGRRIKQYDIYRSATQAAYPTSRASGDLIAPLGHLLLTDATGLPAGRRHFSFILATPLAAGENVWVRPEDLGNDWGAPSASFPDSWSIGGNTPPVANDMLTSVPAGTPRTLTLSANDADGDNLTFAIATPPQHGALNTASLPSVIYTPAAGYTGSDSFTYTASDGQATSSPALVTINVTAAQQLRAFPGAEGFGAFATGGRGGPVIYVTNLNASGPGSLQAALDVDGPKYVLFKVSGVINGHVEMSRGDVTVAGQTSPGGIIVRGWICDPDPYLEDDDTGLLHHAENFILRDIRTRPDFDNPTLGGEPSDDALRLHHCVNGIVDHFSCANANDECIQISWTRDLTIQNTQLAETLGDHAYLGGMLINYSNPEDNWPLTRLSIHHNCWNRIMGRMPELARESPHAAGSIMELELSNNLLWDPGIGIQVAAGRGQLDNQPVYYALNWVGNRAVGRASFPEPTAQAPGWTFGMLTPDFLLLSPNQTTTYFQDNINQNFPTFPDYQQVYCCNDYDQQIANDPGGLPFPSNANPGAFARTTRQPFPEITYTPSSALVAYMRNHVGAFPRDPMDRRLLAPLQSGTIDPARRDEKHLPDDTYSLDFAPGSPPAAPLDTDNDGMPDAWETIHGLNPNLDDHNGTGLSLAETGVDGYTNLDVYLNQLMDQLAQP